MRDLIRSGRRAAGRRLAAARFRGSADYWESRYSAGGDSGAGSTGRLASFKAETLNGLLKDYEIYTLLELGCGDGEQLRLIDVDDYIGVDVAAGAVAMCQAKYQGEPGRRFFVAGDKPLPAVDATLSMDVLLHLVEDDVFDSYLRDLFSAARRAVIIYGADVEISGTMPHVRYRLFTPWIDQHIDGWKLHRIIPGPWPRDTGSPETTSDAGFYVYVPTSIGAE